MCEKRILLKRHYANKSKDDRLCEAKFNKEGKVNIHLKLDVVLF